jgi:hypothetical protein
MRRAVPGIWTIASAKDVSTPEAMDAPSRPFARMTPPLSGHPPAAGGHRDHPDFGKIYSFDQPVGLVK